MTSRINSNSAQADASNRYERILNSCAPQTNENSAIYAEAARKARYDIPVRDEKYSIITSVASGVAGPVLSSYVLWILNQALEMGLKRLYFISRDGEVLLELAQRLLPAFWPKANLELRYLWGSRQAWMLPSFAVSTSDITRYVLQYYQNSSLKTCFGRVALAQADVEKILPRYGFSVENWERPLQRLQLNAAESLVGNPSIQARIQARAQEFKDVTLGYLEQEGLFEEVPYGLVDLGWAGVQKAALEGLLSIRGKTSAPFFFFGRNDHKCGEDTSVLHAYHFNLMRSVGLRREQTGITILMEMFCASLAGGLRHYEYVHGKYEPQFRASNTDAIREWGFEYMRNSILRFADNLAALAPILKSPVYLSPDVSDALLRAFWAQPSSQEARVWGQFPFEEDPSGASLSRLVPPVKLVNFWRVLVFGRGFKEYCEWNRGVIAANPPLVKLFWLLCLSGYKTRKILQHVVLRQKR